MGMTGRITGRWRVAAKLAVLIGVIVIASSQFMGTPRAADPIKVGWVGPLFCRPRAATLKARS